LWVLHSGWGWQIHHVTRQPASGESSQLSIGGLLLATAAIAAAVASVRSAAPLADASPAGFMIPVAIAGTVAAVLSLAIIVPALFATLKARRLSVSLSIYGAFPGIVLLIMLVIAEYSEDRWASITSFVTMFVLLLAPMLVLRYQGYGLHRVTKRRSPQPSAN